MNSVDVANQLQNSYYFQHWMKRRKWWWELFMWGFAVMLVDTYNFYKKAHLIIWFKKKDEILSQYEFRKGIALSSIQKKTENVAENDNNNSRGRYYVTGSSAGSSI